MKTFVKLSFFVLVLTVLFSSCGSDKTTQEKETPAVKETKTDSDNPAIAGLSSVTQKSYDESSKIGCECLKTHSTTLNGVFKEVEPIILEAEKSKKPADTKKMSESLKKLQEFLVCFDKAGDEQDPAAAKAKEDDFKKILGDNSSEQMAAQKEIEIINYFLGKNCPEGQKIFNGFLSLNEKMAKLNQ